MISDSNGEESAFHDGLAMIEVEASYSAAQGFIDKDGKLVVLRGSRMRTPSEGLAAATESESGDAGWGYIDKSGFG